jgi:urease accessory protein UreH
VLRERFALKPNSQEFAAMKRPFPNGYYASACVVNNPAWQHEDWISEINAIQSDQIRIGASRLFAAGWNIKLLTADSLTLQQAVKKLRQTLAKFFPGQNHYTRIFGFSH